MLLSEYILIFLIQQKTCYCYDNVDNYRKMGSEQCYYQDFPNNPDELYGAPNPGSVVVFKYHQTRPVAAGNKNLFRFYSETKPEQITIFIPCKYIVLFKKGQINVFLFFFRIFSTASIKILQN